jgi:hypothetical protein
MNQRDTRRLGWLLFPVMLPISIAAYVAMRAYDAWWKRR